MKAIDKSGAIRHPEDVMDWDFKTYNPGTHSIWNMMLRKMRVDHLKDNLKNTGSLILNSNKKRR